MRSIAALTCLILPLLGADTVLHEEARGGMRQRFLGLDRDSFTETHVESLARTELFRIPRVNFLRLVMYGEDGGPPLPQRGGSLDAYWLRLYDSLPKRNEIAEMVRIGGNASFRMQDQNGRVVERVLERSDPLQVDVDGVRFRILWFHFSDGRFYRSVRVYVHTTGPLREDSGLRLLSILDPVLAGYEASVHISNDDRFLGVKDFPFVNPFAVRARPTEQDFADFEKRRVLACGHWRLTPTCHQE